MKLLQRKPKYYSLDNILSYKATYNIVFGERSNGKTYAALKHAIEQRIKKGKQVAIIRRWQEDIRGARAQNIFKGVVANGELQRISNGRYEGIHYYSGTFYLCSFTEEGKPLYNKEEDVLGYAFALTDTEHNKSVSFPHIGTVVFDEFLTRGAYLPDEFVLFMNTLSTIIRQKTDVQIFMLGNTVNKFSPYFKEMGLTNILKMEQGSIEVYRYGNSNLTVAVEYCDSTAKTKENNFFFAFDNPKLQMITSGAWELDIYPHLPVKYKPRNILFTYFIKFEDRVFQCEVVQVDSEVFTYIHNKTTPIQNESKDLIYSLEYNHQRNYCRNIFVPTTQIGTKIAEFFKYDKVFYQDNEVGDVVNNYLKICKGGRL